VIDSSQITVLIPTSAIPLHPDTRIMDETVAGIRHHLPDAHIIIMADGIWSQLEHRRGQYEEYLKRVENKYSNTQIIRFQQHTQQTAMAQYAIQNFVRTKFIWWNEHDAPLRTDRPIDWDAIFHEVESGNAGLVRFTYWDEGIHEAHEHLVRGRYRVGDSTFVKTIQFSGWSFLTTVNYFVTKVFTGQPIGLQMLELRMYYIISAAPWEQYKIVIWVPDGPAQRFRHSNGRGAGVEVRDPCSWEGQ
jgi:hypothetical protein